MSALLLKIEIPIRTCSEANQREHWASKAKRVKSHRMATAWHLANNRGALSVCCAVLRERGLLVRLTRIAPRKLDPGDNLNGSMKAVRDEVAKWLGVDDRDGTGVVWDYDQRPGGVGVYGVEVCVMGAG